MKTKHFEKTRNALLLVAWVTVSRSQLLKTGTLAVLHGMGEGALEVITGTLRFLVHLVLSLFVGPCVLWDWLVGGYGLLRGLYNLPLFVEYTRRMKEQGHSIWGDVNRQILREARREIDKRKGIEL